MAKETAHQLGTPLSSLQGWIAVLKEEGIKHEAFMEMEKDINRLTVVSDVFQKLDHQSTCILLTWLNFLLIILDT